MNVCKPSNRLSVHDLFFYTGVIQLTSTSCQTSVQLLSRLFKGKRRLQIYRCLQDGRGCKYSNALWVKPRWLKEDTSTRVHAHAHLLRSRWTFTGVLPQTAAVFSVLVWTKQRNHPKTGKFKKWHFWVHVAWGANTSLLVDKLTALTDCKRISWRTSRQVSGPTVPRWLKE